MNRIRAVVSRLSALALLLTAPLGVGVAHGRSLESPPEVSWADERHGWTAATSVRCVPAAALCATEDGGRTWRGIFDAKDVSAYYRSSRDAGIVWADGPGRIGSPAEDGSAAFWTRDRGRHWYQSRVLGGEAAPAVAGSDRLWIAKSFPAGLAEIRPWPPRARARCHGRWVSGLAPLRKSRVPKNICAGALVDAGMRRRLVVEFDSHYIRQLIRVPGGVAGIAGSMRTTTTVAFVAWRSGARYETLLSVGPSHFVAGSAVLAAQWPLVLVSVDVIDNPFEPDDAGSGVVVFQSTDGGVSWRRVAVSQ